MKKQHGLWGMVALLAAVAFVLTGCFESPQPPAADSSRSASPASRPAAAGADHPAGGDHPSAAPNDTGSAPVSQPAASEHPEHPGGDHPVGR